MRADGGINDLGVRLRSILMQVRHNTLLIRFDAELKGGCEALHALIRGGLGDNLGDMCHLGLLLGDGDKRLRIEARRAREDGDEYPCDDKQYKTTADGR